MKEEGNRLFQLGKFDAAIEAYTEAICQRPDVAVYYTNRAMCHHRKGVHEATIADCDRALSLDSKLLKALFFKGISLERLSHNLEALEALEHALVVSTESKSSSFTVDIEAAIITTKKKIAKDKLHRADRRLSQLRDDAIGMIDRALELRQQDLAKEFDGEELEALIAKETQLRHAQQETWRDFIDSMRPHQVTAMDVPDFISCRISMHICSDPVVTPSGITYEREAISSFLQRSRNGEDPITRTPLRINQLYSNTNIKSAISAFYDRHPYADDMVDTSVA